MQPQFDTPPKITISVTNSCNLNCRHCYGNCSQQPTDAELSTQEWKDFFNYLHDNDFIQIYFEGGEPFHRQDFTELLRDCAPRFMTLVRTNGTLITRSLAQELKSIGVGRVLVDLMGATTKTHGWFNDDPSSFDKSCDGIRNLVDAGIPTYTLLILTRRNVAELQSYVNLAHSLGATRAGILRLYPLGRSRDAWGDLALSLEEQTAALEALQVPEGISIMQSWHPKNHNCCWQSAAVDAFGNSIGCMYLREYVNYGDVREIPFLHSWENNALYRQLRDGQVERSCGPCTRTQGSRGGCRSTAFAFHGRWDAPDPFCSTLNHGVDLRVLPQRIIQKDSRNQGPSSA